MKPHSNSKFDPIALEKLRRIWPAYAAAKCSVGSTRKAVHKLPGEIAFKLTNRCNLRCLHCYQWNKSGHHHDLAAVERNRDLDFATLERVYRETEDLKSNIFLWGGEPLLYTDWERLVELMGHDRRWTTICTNGLLIEKRLPSLLRISEQLEILVAIDGLAQTHDSLRGRGSFDRVLRAIDLLRESRKNGEYKGEISINCVISDEMVDRLDEFVQYWQDRAVDVLYLGMPWYLSAETSQEMDRYCAQHTPWHHVAASGTRPSWHAYKYCMDPGKATALIAALKRLNQSHWKIKLRYNPALEPDEVADFIAGSSKPAQAKTRCLAIRNRMDVMPNGEVVSCKFFPESVVGNLQTQSVAEVWHGQAFMQVRDTLDRCGLMPVCSKCNLLYSRGV